MSNRDEVSRCALSVTLFILLLALAVNVMHVIELDTIAHQSTVVVSKPEKRGMLRAGTSHGPIVIDGDDNFATTAFAEGWLGDGSPEDPFIIDGLDIDFVDIRNTRVSFTLRKCNLISGRLFGIRLGNVKNGEIVNNTCSDNSYGIHLLNSSSNTVVNNTVCDVGVGICVEGSASIIVSNNNCSNNMVGISLEESSSNTVTNNTCLGNHIGISLYYSNSTTVANNTCTNYGNSYGPNHGIYLTFSDYNTVVNNACNGNRWGIHLENSNSNIVANNTCLGNAEHDISLDDSDSNTLANNIISIPKELVNVVLLLIGLVGITLLGVGLRRAFPKGDKDDIIVPTRHRLVSWLKMRRPIRHVDVDESLEHDSPDQ
ncbi:MAG: nitrous oxide reductase family maturation protein NosD [Candidatus Thorarchaeota archaeon]